MNIYGIVNKDGIHTDMSTSLKGAKRMATLRGYDKVSVRYNCGYTVQVLFEKINNKWKRVK